MKNLGTFREKLEWGEHELGSHQFELQPRHSLAFGKFLTCKVGRATHSFQCGVMLGTVAGTWLSRMSHCCYWHYLPVLLEH